MQIDTPILAIIITVVMSIIGLAVAWGALGQKVRKHDEELDRLHNENRADHQRLFDKLEEMNAYIRNGRPKA